MTLCPLPEPASSAALDAQAYRELREDGHPVLVLAGRDLTDILKASGLDDVG